ncbi:phosphoribosylformylglycinamidine cyclo-ligase [Candidatus Peregrinibacteria bacterium CG10_big_fil_rev_8_21_14_0_10_49_10]|nr:MAG: phosphoribosylformylglycinamidine cyclo-ligase [Candidatus Peregrinibacteria bacterium CG10_big_fil_rev_8_21_14_0_10_49_10]
MTTYKDSGVNVASGDAASKAAYTHAAATFASRKGMVGEPVLEEDGYAGFLDMGDYALVMSDDSTGTKIDLADHMKKFDTLGYDLLAMVADDVVCTGAEVVAVSNCLDVPKVDEHMVDALLSGLSKACTEQKIVIPAGEIAEVPGAVNRGVWSATALGVVQKEKIIKPETIEVGDVVIALQSHVARSNGFSLIRKILSDAFGEDWHNKEWKQGMSWGEVMLSPSIVYHSAILSLTGRYGEERNVNVKGIAHITGGGIPSKFRRILRKSGLGARLTDLWPPHEALRDLIALGEVPIEEAYRTWNMGNGMLLVVAPKDVDASISALKNEGIEAKKAGEITKDATIVVEGFDGEELRFS